MLIAALQRKECDYEHVNAWSTIAGVPWSSKTFSPPMKGPWLRRKRSANGDTLLSIWTLSNPWTSSIMTVYNVVTQNATVAANAVPGVLLAVAAPRDHGYGLAACGKRLWNGLDGRLWRFALSPRLRTGSRLGSKKNLELIWRILP